MTFGLAYLTFQNAKNTQTKPRNPFKNTTFQRIRAIKMHFTINLAHAAPFFQHNAEKSARALLFLSHSSPITPQKTRRQGANSEIIPSKTPHASH